MAKAKHWMQAAVPKSHEGRFTKKAKAAGESVHEYAEEKQSAPGKTGAQARLALRFEQIAKRKKG